MSFAKVISCIKDHALKDEWSLGTESSVSNCDSFVYLDYLTEHPPKHGAVLSFENVNRDPNLVDLSAFGAVAHIMEEYSDQGDARSRIEVELLNQTTLVHYDLACGEYTDDDYDASMVVAVFEFKDKDDAEGYAELIKKGVAKQHLRGVERAIETMPETLIGSFCDLLTEVDIESLDKQATQALSRGLNNLFSTGSLREAWLKCSARTLQFDLPDSLASMNFDITDEYDDQGSYYRSIGGIELSFFDKTVGAFQIQYDSAGESDFTTLDDAALTQLAGISVDDANRDKVLDDLHEKFDNCDLCQFAYDVDRHSSDNSQWVFRADLQVKIDEVLAKTKKDKIAAAVT